MQVHPKPRLDKSSLHSFLSKFWSQPITKLENLVEGEDSQAAYFESDHRRYVLRINKSDYGFKKDVYAYDHFASARIPIAPIVQLGEDAEYAYCINQWC